MQLLLPQVGMMPIGRRQLDHSGSTRFSELGKWTTWIASSCAIDDSLPPASGTGKALFFCILQRNVKPEDFILKAPLGAMTTFRTAIDAVQN
jgi:hypothetical protein